MEWHWWADNAIALIALVVAGLVAIGNLIGFFLRTPRAFWVIDALDVEEWGENPEGTKQGVGGFKFRNAGNGIAYLTTVELKYNDDGFFALNGLIKLTVKPDETVDFQISGPILDVLRPQVVRFMSGEDFILDTPAVMRITWTHRPARWTVKRHKRFVLRDEQNYVMPTRSIRSQ